MKKLLTFLLLVMSVSVMGQTYNKNLKKAAKNGDVTAQRDLGICYLYGYGTKVNYQKAYEWLMMAGVKKDGAAQYHLGVMCEKRYINKLREYNVYTDLRIYRDLGGGKQSMYGNYYVLIYELAYENGSKEAPVKLYEFYKNDGRPIRAMEWLKIVADAGDKDYQFEYAKVLLEEGKESEAKLWLKKASDGGHSLAKTEYDKILQHEKEVAEEVQRKAREAARRDSIAAVELARQMAEAERQRKQDSIDIAEGRKLPKKDQLLSGCRVFSRTTQATYSYEFKESFFYRELIALCSNDVLAYYGKSRMDDLDKALYKKSEEYRTDLSNFNKKRNEKMAIVFPLDKLSEPEWEFSSTGFSFRALGTKPSPTDNANLLGLMDLVFPVNPNLVKPDDHLKCWHTFKCSNLLKLQEIRANKDNLEMLYIFKPGAKAISRYWSADVMDYVYLVNPIALYLLNSNTGEVVLDLSNCLRKTGIAADKQRIEAYAKNHYNKIKPKKHSTPKQQRCLVCGGKGYTEYYPVGSAVLKRERCTYCYGKGYTIDYVY